MPATQKDRPLTGTILEIQRMSTEDGPGIRTTVFLKGCPLACGWCHNPESISPRPQVQWVGVNCIGCGICVKACPRNARRLDPDGVHIDRALCVGCGTCAGQCPAGAAQLLGTAWDSDSLVRELVKDRAYFEQSGGGVTLSGGEAAMQPEFCRALLRGLAEEGIQTALDTCGQLSRRDLESLFPLIDILLFDVKEMDREKHRRFTGRGNAKILENLRFAGQYAREHRRFHQFWIRTPLIPGATARAENIRAIGAFIAGHLDGVVDRWELCAFNNLCRDKYRRLGLEWDYARSPLLSREQMESFAAIAKASGVDPAIVSWSGSTLLEKDEGMQAGS
jgi:pyruvate formate lyase activating enzyme